MSFLVTNNYQVAPVIGIFRKDLNGDYREEKIVLPSPSDRKANYVEESASYKTVKKRFHKISYGYRFQVEFAWYNIEPEVLDVLTEIANLDKRFSIGEEDGYLVLYPHKGNVMWKERILFADDGWQPSHPNSIVFYDDLLVRFVGVELRKERPTANNLIQAFSFPHPASFNGVDTPGDPVSDAGAGYIGGGDVDPDEAPVDTQAPVPIQAMAISPTQVEIIFDEPLDQASAETLGNYSIDNALSVSAVSNPTSTKVVLTTGTQVDNTTYTITVNNVKDKNNNATSNATVAFQGYGSTAYPNAPNLVNIIALSKTSLLLLWDEPLDQVSAETASNYSIPGLTVSASVLAVNVVTLTTSTQSGQMYTLTVNNVTNVAGVAVSNVQIAFEGHSSNAPVVHSITKSPEAPEATDQVTVTAKVADDNTVSTVKLKYRLDYSGGWVTVSMTLASGVWSAVIPAQSDGVVVEYKIKAIDSDGNETFSGTYTYVSGFINYGDGVPSP